MNSTSNLHGHDPNQSAAGAFDRIPNELIHKILEHVSPEDSYARVPLLSKRFNELSRDQGLWRDYCLQSFRHWHHVHRLEDRLAKAPTETQWRSLWYHRKCINARIARLFDEVIASKVNRLEKIGKICKFSHDAKDFLLEQCRIPDAAEDSLARRYYANTALSSIHRGFAIEAWSPYQRAPLTFQGVDRALGAFDMFFVRADEWDIDETCALLDQLAEEFRQEHEDFTKLCARDKALTLLKWVRERSLTGMDNATENYRCLRNCLIGFALRDETHPSTPVVSSAIYVSLAERLELQASCCAFPTHAHVLVTAPRGQDLQGKDLASRSAPLDKMFLDPYSSSEEVHSDDLRRHLSAINWVEQEPLLVSAPIPALVQRIGHNMRMTFNDLRGRVNNYMASDHLIILRDGTTASRNTIESAIYASHWANLLMTPVTNVQWDTTLDEFLHYVTHHFPEDAYLVEEYILPLYNIYTQSVQPRRRFTLENVPEVLRLLKNSDARQPTTSRRYTQEIHQNVWYSVGQVFRHKRYGYVGIINGWGEKGTASLPATHNMSMDELMDEMSDSGTDSDTLRARLRKKVFYTCLTPKHDRAVVSQDAIEIMRDPSSIPVPLMEVAGKFFKKFDSATCTFASNIKEYFPDD